MLTMITANWTAEALKCIIFENKFCWTQEYGGWSTTAGACLAFVVSFLFLYKYRWDFVPIKNFSEEEVRPHRCLIIPISSPWRRGKERDVEIINAENGKFRISVKNMDTGDFVKIPQNKLSDDIDRLEGTGWSWQQLLRGIEKHVENNKLEQIYLIGSPDTKTMKGSHSVLNVAESIIRDYIQRIKKIHKHQQPVDFEVFNSLTDALNKAISTFKEEGYHENDIIIDITGGQKTTSIAGAAVTLDNKVTFQYVQTNPDEKGEYKVLAYDVVIQSPPSL